MNTYDYVGSCWEVTIILHACATLEVLADIVCAYEDPKRGTLVTHCDSSIDASRFKFSIGRKQMQIHISPR